MVTKLENFLQPWLKKNLPDVRPGDTVRVHLPSRQIFEGIVIARKHSREPGATITVRKVISGIGVERIFPLHSPLIEKIEILKRGKVRKAKLYYLREAKGRGAKIKEK